MVVGYIRVSTIKQDSDNQLGEINRWCTAHGMNIDEIVSETISSRKEDRKIFDLIKRLHINDILIVTELSRIARSLKEMLQIIEYLMENKIRVVILKESIDIHDDNPAGKLTVSIIGSIAEFERNMISLRTKEAIASKRATGISIGRPSGAKNKSRKLDGKETKIKEYLDKGMKKTEIAKMLDISRDTLYSYLRELGL
jgi:DNA invertase Pin-like site-specific DNA recombinase